MKSSFNIGLVEIESHIVSKNVFLTTFLVIVVCCHPIALWEVRERLFWIFFVKAKINLQKIEKMQNELKN